MEPMQSSTSSGINAHTLSTRMSAKAISWREWASEVLQVMRECNNSCHRTVDMSPRKANKKTSKAMLNRERNTHTHNLLNKQCDRGRYMLTRDNYTKERDARYSREVATVRSTKS